MRSVPRSRGASRPDVLAALALLAFGAVCVPGALRAQEGQLERANRARCSNYLRQLGLAAIQYADDKRFFPHVGKIKDLDGGYRTNVTPRLIRALTFYGYHDDPEGFVCPSSQDEWLPAHEAARADMRRWLWGGKENTDATTSPLLVDGKDPTLAETSELSYGWTRRGLTSNARSSSQLAADRMKDNHVEGGNVLQADGTVGFSPAASYDGPLAATEGTDAAWLSVRAKDDPAPTRAVTGPPAPWAGTFTDGVVTLSLAPRPSGWSSAPS